VYWRGPKCSSVSASEVSTKENEAMNKGVWMALVLVAPLAAQANPENYTLDPNHTYPHFEVDHLGLSTMRGMFNKSSGKFTIDRVAKTGSIELAVETASINTG